MRSSFSLRERVRVREKHTDYLNSMHVPRTFKTHRYTERARCLDIRLLNFRLTNDKS